jgi:hypothetical protein
VVSTSEHPNVEKALRGRDEQALVRALRQAGAEKILVAVDSTDPQLMPPPTLRNVLGTYRSLDHFRAVYVSQAAGLFEIVEPVRVSDDAGRELVKIARAALLGQDAPRNPSEEVRRRRQPQVQVAVSIQGLRPIKRDSASVNFNRRDLFIVRPGDSLAEATRSAAARIREQWASTGTESREGTVEQAMERLTIEVEVIHDESPIAIRRPPTLNPMAYKRHLWNAVELGIHGLAGAHRGSRKRYLLPSSAAYRARPDVESFLERLARQFDLNGDGAENEADERLFPSADGLVVYRFRTHHFREMEPNGDVRRLIRGFVPVGQDVVTEENVRKNVQLAASWLVANQLDDGLYEYKYYPTRDSYYREFHDDHEEAHNIVRHGLAAYSMFMVARELDDTEIWDSALRATQVMLDNTVIGPAWFADEAQRARLPEERREACTDDAGCDIPEQCLEGFCRLPFGPPVVGTGRRHAVAPGSTWESHDGYRRPLDPAMMYVRWKDVGKMGAVAAVVMALSEILAERPELLDRYRPFLEGYAAFLRFMQRPNGAFNHYFTAPGDVRYYNTETTIYPGEILFALSRLYRLLGDETIREAFDRGLRHYAEWFRAENQRINPDGTYPELRRNDLVAFVPWVTMACNDMYQQRRDPFVAEIGIEASDWIVRRYQYDPERTYYPAYLGSYFRVWWEQAAMHGIVYTEGTAAGFNLARLAGDRERIERQRRATLLGLRFAIQQVTRPGIDDHYLPGERARMRSRGCVRFSLTVPDCRTDYAYHSLSAMVQSLRYFRTEDWAMPPAE